MDREFYVYRYTDKKGKVAYIGKTNCSLKARVDAHKREPAFAGEDWVIDFVKLANKVETDSVEKLLINYYKPRINIKDKVPFLSENANLPELNWQPISAYYFELASAPNRRSVLLKDVSKRVATINALLSGESKVTLPFLPPELCFEGAPVSLFKKDVVAKNGGYELTLKKDSEKFAMDHCLQLYYEAWIPYIQSLSLKPENEELVMKGELLSEFSDLVLEFERDGFISEGLGFDECIILPKECEKIVPIVMSSLNKKPMAVPTGLLTIWDRKCAEKFSKDKDYCFGKIITLLKGAGVICEEELERYE